MEYMWKDSEYKRSCNTQFLVITIFLSVMLIQAIVTCGANPLAYLPTALAVSHVGCVNPELPNNNNGTAAPPTTPGIVVINEILTFPQSQWNCTSPDDNTFNVKNAWVEIYNPQNEPVDLYAAHASIDEGPGTDPYMLHVGSIITAHGFLVVFPFQYLSPDAYTQLSSVRLQFTPQVVIDQVSIPSLAPETSYARNPDGYDTWQITTVPTLGSSNQDTTGTGQTGSDTGTHNRTIKQKATKTHSGRISNDEASTDTSTTGVQPTWSALRLPSSASNNVTTQPRNSSLSPTTPADPFDLLKKTLLTLLVVAFFSALSWWRLHRKKCAQKAHS
jgi:hypothetical protein